MSPCFLRTPLSRLFVRRPWRCLLGLLILNSCGANNGLAAEPFHRASVEADLTVLEGVLIASHIAPFAYTDETDLRAAFTRAKESLKGDSISQIEAYRALQQSVAAVQNGHTSVVFPAGPYIEFANGGGTLFPLELALENGDALVRKNHSTNKVILPGDRLVDINGVSIDEVLQDIYPLVSAEQPYYANAKIEAFSFPRYYWFAFGEIQNYTVSVEHSGGLLGRYALPAVPAIEGFEKRRNEILSSQQELRLLDDVALLNPGALSGDETAFQAFVDQAFTAIQAAQPSTLILDLRNNPGGDDTFSDYLVSYVANHPFRWNHHFTVKTSESLKDHAKLTMTRDDMFTQAILTHPNGKAFRFDFGTTSPQPSEKRFAGKVIVLINRQTYSQAAVTAAQLQDYGWAELVGEETAEFPTLYASVFPYALPNTGITVQISKGQIVRVSGDVTPRGVVPDVVIHDHLLDDNDEALTGLLSLLAAGTFD